MAKFTGTEKEWQIVVSAIANYAESVEFYKETLHVNLKNSVDEIQKLFVELQYEKEG